MDLVAPQSTGLTRSHGCLYEPNDNHRDSSQYVGFEQMWQNNSYQLEVRLRSNFRLTNKYKSKRPFLIYRNPIRLSTRTQVERGQIP